MMLIKYIIEITATKLTNELSYRLAMKNIESNEEQKLV